MKKIFVFISAIVVMLFAFCLVASAADTHTEHKNGEQIELYTLSNASCEIDSIAKGTYVSCIIDDTSVAIINDNRIEAIGEGFTYITIDYGDYAVNHNIIVHDGYDKVDKIKLNGKEVSSDGESVKVETGEEYTLTVNDDENFDFSNARVYLISPYGEIPFNEFVSNEGNGRIKIVGIGSCDMVVKLSTNKSDKGIRLHLDSGISNSTLYNAIIRFYIDNEFEMQNVEYESSFITATELELINELRFSTIYNSSSDKWKNIMPNLKELTFNFSKTNMTTLGTLTVNDDGLKYNFVGKPSVTYTFSLSSKQRDSLDISFKDFNYCSQETAMNVSKVSSTFVSFDGNCQILVYTARNSYNGSNAISAAELSIELMKDAGVTVRGGNGGGSSSAGGTLNVRRGGIGIEATVLVVKTKGYSETTSLNVTGGNGGYGFSSGNSGGNGGIGIKANDIELQGYISVEVRGGNGGNGAAGTSYYSTASSGWTPGAGRNGTNGTAGRNGQKGGDGGNGANGILANSIATDINVMLNCVGGNGANGAKGGQGGNGGNGGNGGSTTGHGGSNAGNGGSGGRGGNGGKGGNAGCGANALAIENNDCLKMLNNVALIHGYSGNAGSGGSGGRGGNGGNGGDDRHWGSILGIPMGEGPIQGNGGSRGAGGTGGAAGSYAQDVELIGLPDIKESIAQRPVYTNATAGANGAYGTNGSDGDHGSMG